MKPEGELSKTMKACMDFCRAHQDQILRFPGGFWGSRGGGDPWFGTTTIQALVLRGFLEYAEWKGNPRFPIKAVIAGTRAGKTP